MLKSVDELVVCHSTFHEQLQTTNLVEVLVDFGKIGHLHKAFFERGVSSLWQDYALMRKATGELTICISNPLPG